MNAEVLALTTLVFTYFVLGIALYDYALQISSFLIEVIHLRRPTDQTNEFSFSRDVCILFAEVLLTLVEVAMAITLLTGIYMRLAVVMFIWIVYAGMHIGLRVASCVWDLCRPKVNRTLFFFDVVFLCIYMVTLILVTFSYKKLVRYI